MRIEHWEAALTEWARNRCGAPFEWGQTDCAMLCFEAFDALTGEALAARYRGRYASERSALRFMAEHGIDLRWVLIEAGCLPVAKGFQQRGDFMLVPIGAFVGGHVCLGDRVISAPPGGRVGYGWLGQLLRYPSLEILRII